MDKRFIFRNEIGLTNRTVRNSRSHHDDTVCKIHGFITIAPTIISHHTKIKRVIVSHNAESHHRTDNRNMKFMGKISNQFFHAG